MIIDQTEFNDSNLSVGEWLCSDREDRWSYPFGGGSKDDAIKEGKAAWDGDAFWVGTKAYPDVDIISAESMIESMCEKAYERHGEVCEDFLVDVSDQAKDDLDQTLAKVVGEWLTRHNLWPIFFSVKNVEMIKPEDIGDGDVPD